MSQEEKVTLEWLKDEEKMRTATEKELMELSKLYVKDIMDTSHACYRCGTIKKVSEMYILDEGMRGYYCSHFCYKGRSKKKRKK